MAYLSISLLGGLTIEQAGVPLTAFESEKCRFLLAYLAAESDRAHSRESLIGLFWAEKPERRARHSLSQALWSLTKLGPGSPLIDVSRNQVSFQVENMRLDVQEFEALIQSCRSHGHNIAAHNEAWACRPCLERLEKAALLYRGDLLAGADFSDCPAFEEWVLERQAAYREEMHWALQHLAGGFALLGELDKALTYATREITLDPLDESAHRQVMELLERLGRRSEALAQYLACQKVLQSELGVEPEEATTRLYQRILVSHSSGEPVSTSPHNLPAALTLLIGRDRELQQIYDWLVEPSCRLLTVLGGGGVGKSHLALEAARRLLPAFKDGVFLVVLDTTSSSQALAPLIAQAVGLELRLGRAGFGSAVRDGLENTQAQLRSYLSGKKMLLLLDGFEQALREISLVSSLLRRAPGVSLLITSRARLNLEAEQILPLEGLAFPLSAEADNPGSSAAVQLFLQAARRSVPGFALTVDNQSAVAAICCLAQGLPLGILLAASWVGTLEPAQILKEIRRSLDILNADWQDLPSRQRSLRATFDHSLRLLSEEDQTVFLRLAVFHTPFTAERAIQAAGASLQQIRALINQSLLMPASTEADRSISRYRLHDLLRQYAQERLVASTEAYRQAHAQHAQAYLGALAAWESPLKSHAQPAVLKEMDLEYADLLTAWRWVAEHLQVEAMQAAFEPLSYYHTLRGYFHEDAALCQEAMGSLERETLTPSILRLWVLICARLALDFRELAEYDLAFEVIHKAERVLAGWQSSREGIDRPLGWLHLAKGEVYIYTGKNLPAMEAFRQGSALLQRGNDPWDTAFGLMEISVGYGQLGDVRQMGRLALEAQQILEELGDPYLLAHTQTNLIFYHLSTGNYQAGLQALQEQDATLSIYEDPFSCAYTHTNRGVALFHSGRFAEARKEFEGSIALEATTEKDSKPISLLAFLECIDLHLGRYADVLADTPFTGLAPDSYDHAIIGLYRAQAHLLEGQAGVPTDLDQAEAELQSYLKHHNQLPRYDMLGIPLALLGYTAYRRGNLEEAHQYLDQALSNSIETGFFGACLTSLSVLALLLAENGELEQAAELYATVTTHPCAANSKWWEDMFGKPIASLTAKLPAEIVCEAQARGAEQNYFEVGQQWLEKLKSRDPKLYLIRY